MICDFKRLIKVNRKIEKCFEKKNSIQNQLILEHNKLLNDYNEAIKKHNESKRNTTPDNTTND